VAAVSKPHNKISAHDVAKAGTNDLLNVVAGVQYLGLALSRATIDSWLAQFPDEIRPLGVRIVRQVAARYYISLRSYHEAVGTLVRESGIPRQANVSFCRWQSLGRSAPRIASDLKTRGRWTPAAEIDLDFASEVPPSAPHPQWIVFADDFVGSGRMISRLVKVSAAPLIQLAERFPQSQIRILIVAGFEAALQKLHRALVPFHDRVQLRVVLLLRNEDRCFSPDSQIFPDPNDRERLRQFCVQTAKACYPGFPKDMRLGYGRVGALTVFFDRVPNNTLPLIWHDEGSWLPLFPASGASPAEARHPISGLPQPHLE
jgi:hypothetical protein